MPKLLEKGRIFVVGCKSQLKDREDVVYINNYNKVLTLEDVWPRDVYKRFPFTRECGDRGFPGESGPWYNYCSSCAKREGLIW